MALTFFPRTARSVSVLSMLQQCMVSQSSRSRAPGRRTPRNRQIMHKQTEQRESCSSDSSTNNGSNVMSNHFHHSSSTSSRSCSHNTTSMPSTETVCRTDDDSEDFLQRTLGPLLSKVTQTYTDPSGKVVDFLQPEELKKRLDFTLGDEPVDNKELQELCERAMHYSVKTGHPHFFNQLFAGVDKYALSGALLAESLNGSAYTYEIGPVHCFLEQELVNKVGTELIGWPEVDGIFCPGGSMCNMYGLSMARHNKYPESKEKGLQALPPIHIFTSKLSHYSIKKGAMFMGFGSDNLISVPTDNIGRMIPKELEQLIESSISKGITPLMVNATAGTTVYGAYDPLEEIGDFCKKYGIWLHVDAAFGGAALLSPTLRETKLKGIDQADSLTWDPHKMNGSILQCSMFLTRHKNGLMADAHSARARYLFQQDKLYDSSFDTGDKSISCGRKMDAFKLWVQWKAHGSSGMARKIEKCYETALYLRDLVRETDGFKLLIEEPECTNVCFWYIPPSLRDQPETPEWWSQVSKIAPAIKAQMQQQGTTLIGYQPQGEHVNFWRMVVANYRSTKEDMQFVVNEIDRLGRNL